MEDYQTLYKMEKLCVEVIDKVFGGAGLFPYELETYDYRGLSGTQRVSINFCEGFDPEKVEQLIKQFDEVGLVLDDSYDDTVVVKEE